MASLYRCVQACSLIKKNICIALISIHSLMLLRLESLLGRVKKRSTVDILSDQGYLYQSRYAVLAQGFSFGVR